jgi:hypothetical protein
MTQQHLITPPPELVQQWVQEFATDLPHTPEQVYLAIRAAQWGYEQHEKELLDAIHFVVPQPYEPENE